MKISLNWLNDYIETGLSAEKIVQVLSDIGLPCEGVESLGDDTVIDIEVTSNRGDCLSYIGIARELAVATGKQLKTPDVKLNESAKDVTKLASVEIEQPGLCARYTARIIKGVKVGPSPDWLKSRLKAVGLRSVNNVVDATNYALMETGQPPHAFDYEKISGGKIIVRCARAGEELVSIDGTKCKLTADMLIIADTKGPVAIAGVMGGADTEVNEKTTTVLLEDAYFDPVSIRKTSRQLALPSEASYRFERTVDIEMVDWASKRTAQLITQVAGGKVAKGVVDIYPKKPAKKEITLRLSRLNKVLGIEIPQAETLEILSGLSFQPKQKGDSITCAVPSWRSDIYREIDLIEEIARLYGYNRIPTEQKIRIKVVPVDSRQKLAEAVGTYLNGSGFYETITVSFIDNSIAELFAAEGSGEHLSVKDITRKSDNLLRQTLLPSLLTVIKTNLNVKNTPCRIFEVADTFVPRPQQSKENVLPIEKAKLTIACDGDFSLLRGVVEGLIKNVNRDAAVVFEAADLLWAQTGARILVNSELIGTAGIISQAVKDKFDFKDVTPAAAELDFEMLSVLQAGPLKVEPIPKFPAIERDLSIVIDEQVRWTDIAGAVNKKASDELEDVKFVGIYRGKGIPAGQKSLTLTLRFRDSDGTLTHEMVDRFQADILNSLTESTGAQLRTI
ncbi:MAG: phenylalanine--tRNA ligase subunit beta [Phycisphaerae bacterium]|nr:phenylalanine--tRNA ligase subunit beta [Phycisphaerae bacterium]MDD5380847.1 phenylalanine--tRNA ligase subunit beta [Phycisphaerae bacterium]